MAYKNLKLEVLSGIGTGMILSLGVIVTYELYVNGVENAVYTNNYTTSVLFSDTLTTASGAAPWALLSLNWFACKAVIKKWRGYMKRFI